MPNAPLPIDQCMYPKQIIDAARKAGLDVKVTDNNYAPGVHIITMRADDGSFLTVTFSRPGGDGAPVFGKRLGSYAPDGRQISYKSVTIGKVLNLLAG